MEEIRNEINVKNVAAYYQIAKLFNFTELAKVALCYIERCFTTVCETNSFLELDFAFVMNILAKYTLNIDSELEVLNAAEKWMSYKYEERSKYAKQLLLKIRLHLLPCQYLNSPLSKELFFNKIDDCVDILREVLQNKKNIYLNKQESFFSYRFCTQNMFNIIVSGGIHNQSILDCVQRIDGENFAAVNNLDSMIFGRRYHKTIYCKGSIYVFGGYDNKFTLISSIEKYSLTTNAWEHIADISDDRDKFCACAFMDDIFILGGQSCNYEFYNSCLKLDTVQKKWEQVVNMNDVKSDAACTVFEGRVVVSGGYQDVRQGHRLNTVEVYDHVTDTWSYIPHMREERVGHSLVAYIKK